MSTDDRASHKIKSIELSKSILATAGKLIYAITYDADDDATSEADKPPSVCIKGGFAPELMAKYPFLIEIYERVLAAESAHAGQSAQGQSSERSTAPGAAATADAGAGSRAVGELA